jgi:pimeloyl-ACP methyl ester carboxylesterase
MKVGVILVHGGCHTATCWQPLLEVLKTPAVAPNLPGRWGSPTPTAEVTIDDCVGVVADAADGAELDRVIVVAHSLGGVTALASARALAGRLAHLVFIAALAPPAGGSALSDVSAPVRRLAHSFCRRGLLGPPPDRLARWLFCNDMDHAMATETVSAMVPDSARLLTDPLPGVHPSVARTYICTARDRLVTPRAQLRQIRNLGTASVHRLDAGHNVMMTRPSAVAEIIDREADLIRRETNGEYGL